MADPSGRDALTRRTFLRAAGLGAAVLTLAGSAPLAGAGASGAAGYPSVAAMLASAPFYVAHRGCSLSWPEMSLYAYTRAAGAGFGALEVSLARTRDGVWFGLHDDSLERTSGVAQLARSLTWAQIARLRIAGPTATDDPTQPGRPYLRWEELVAAFYPSHVLFVDPKGGLDHAAELMGLMNALPGTPTEHLVCKYYGVSGDRRNTSGWARLAADSGYHRWGYFYGADVATLDDYQDRWDLLGMDLAADDEAWAAIAAFGKPVVAHLAATPRDVATARSKRASGVIVASARAVTRTELVAHRSQG